MTLTIHTCSTPVDDLTRAYEREGFFVVDRVLGPDECERLKHEALRILQRDQKSVLVGVAAMSPVYRDLSQDPRLLDRIAPLMPDGITFQSDKFVYKNGAQRFATPWHTDNQYWANRRPKLSVWIPLDDVGEANGTLKVIPGSHKRDWPQVQVDGAESNGEFKNRIDETKVPEDQQVVCELNRGSIVVFSDALLHASTPNTSGQDRYAIISTYHETRVPETETIGPATKVITSTVKAG